MDKHPRTKMETIHGKSEALSILNGNGQYFSFSMCYKKNKKNILLLLVLALLGPVLYFGEKYYIAQTAFVKLDVNIADANTPIINVMIENNIYPLMLDLGSKFSLSLDFEVMEKLIKDERGILKWKDWKGNSYEAKSYLIPEVNICGLSWSNVIGHEENQDQKAAGILWPSIQRRRSVQRVGKIGCPFLERTNLCLDLYHRNIYCCKSLKTLQRMGICPKNMHRIPFHLENNHIHVSAETDIGMLDLVLDTGSTLSIIKSTLTQKTALETDFKGFPFFTSHLTLAENDFEKLRIHVFDVPWPETDGLLGMNFIENHIIYIDFPHRVLYIGDCHF